MTITTIGLDLAKSVFQIYGVDAEGRAVLRRRLRRQDLLAFFARLAPCIVAMEACSSAHHWARELVALGHDVRLIPPQYAKPYVKRNKTDAADAEAICDAVGRPTMRFVPIKRKESQALLALHRVRSLLVRQRTAAVNSARGLLGEFGLVAPKGIRRVGELRRSMEEASRKRSSPRGARGSHGPFRSPRRTDREARHGRGGILAWHKTSKESQRLATAPGVACTLTSRSERPSNPPGLTCAKLLDRARRPSRRRQRRAGGCAGRVLVASWPCRLSGGHRIEPAPVAPPSRA